MDQQTLLITIFVGVAAIAALVALFPSFFGEDVAKQRQDSIKASGAKRTGGADRVVDTAARRKQVADSLKEIDNKSQKKRASLESRITQAGLSWTRNRFYLTSVALAIGLGAGVFLLNESVIAAVLLFIGGFGLPSWWLVFLRKRRLKKFRLAFPDALDVIIRGVKAGLPLGDCLRIVSTDSAEPVRSEFKQIIQTQTLGLPVGEAVDRMADRVPISEASFFAIVINIQQKSGGNLSEALGNLSRVLRDRKKMQGKIKAMSSEAKSSAGIIGSLPFAVGGLVWLTSPHYIELLWLTSTGHYVMMGCVLWMGLGVAVIKKMISFDF